VHAGADLEPECALGVDDGARAANPTRRTIERREEPVARGVDLPSPVAFELAGDYDDSADVQIRGVYDVGRATIANTSGDHRAALRYTRDVFGRVGTLNPRHSAIKFAYVEALEAGLTAGDRDACEWFLSTVEGWRPGSVTPYIRAMTDRFRARLDPASDETEGRFKRAAGLFREIGTPFYLGCTLLEHGEWLAAHERLDDARPLLEETQGIFERLQATPWLERLRRTVPDLARA
jgi:hypothetical protein